MAVTRGRLSFSMLVRVNDTRMDDAGVDQYEHVAIPPSVPLLVALGPERIASRARRQRRGGGTPITQVIARAVSRHMQDLHRHNEFGAAPAARAYLHY